MTQGVVYRDYALMEEAHFQIVAVVFEHLLK